MRALLTGLTLCLLTLPAWAATAYRIETVADGLQHPWSLAWLPDGRLLVTERPGRLRLIENGRLNPQPIAGVPAVHAAGQAGLFEVLPAPDFAKTGWIYLSLVAGDGGGNTLQVMRGRLVEHRLENVEAVFRHQPRRGTSVHYGGRLQFMADGALLVTLGDGFDYREQAQRPSNHFGSIVRINPDGSIPDDNPFVGHSAIRPELFAYGVRNPQGITIHPETGEIWATDHGPRGGDELNRIEAGQNYGWPVATHALDYSGARISPYREVAGTRSPPIVWTPAIAPAGLAVYEGDLFPGWDGQLLVAGLVSQAVHRIRVSDGRAQEEERLFTELDSRIRHVRVGPDEAVYLVTDHEDGRVLRATPAN